MIKSLFFIFFLLASTYSQIDQCPHDPFKMEPGRCGCGFYDSQALGFASDFGLFVFQDMTSQSSDIQTKVAVGRDLKPFSFDFGDPNCYNNPNCPCDPTLIVGANAILNTGNLNNGIMKYGNSSYVPSTFSFPAQCNPPQVHDPSLPASFFTPTQIFLTFASTAWGSLTPTGTTYYHQWDPLGLFIQDPSKTFQIFHLDGSKISGWSNGWKLSPWIYQICSSVPAGSTILININGSSVSILGSDFSCLSNYEVLINLYEATSFQMSNIIPATFLAPLADWSSESTGEIDGAVIANSWSGTVQINQGNLFSGCLPIFGV
jgi:choice-of-anchor A domain-containing protein